MTEPTTIVCPHGPCTCAVSDPGTHCSDACAAHEGDGCGCGHAVCEAFTGRPIDQDMLDPHTLGESMEAPGAVLDATEE
jgi:hypothetical protein